MLALVINKSASSILSINLQLPTVNIFVSFLLDSQLPLTQELPKNQIFELQRKFSDRLSDNKQFLCVWLVLIPSEWHCDSSSGSQLPTTKFSIVTQIYILHTDI